VTNARHAAIGSGIGDAGSATVLSSLGWRAARVGETARGVRCP
jgi:hypothetical protein